MRTSCALLLLCSLLSGCGVGTPGEAVAAGTVMAADLSHRLGWLETAQLERTREILRRAELPLKPPTTLEAQRFRELMAVDKKVREGRLRLVLLEEIGTALVTSDFPDQALDDTLTHFAQC